MRIIFYFSLDNYYIFLNSVLFYKKTHMWIFLTQTADRICSLTFTHQHKNPSVISIACWTAYKLLYPILQVCFTI